MKIIYFQQKQKYIYFSEASKSGKNRDKPFSIGQISVEITFFQLPLRFSWKALWSSAPKFFRHTLYLQPPKFSPSPHKYTFGYLISIFLAIQSHGLNLLHRATLRSFSAHGGGSFFCRNEITEGKSFLQYRLVSPLVFANSA